MKYQNLANFILGSTFGVVAAVVIIVDLIWFYYFVLSPIVAMLYIFINGWADRKKRKVT